MPRAQNGAADALANSAMDGRPVHRDPAAEAVVLEDDVQPTAEPAPVVTTVTHLLRHGQTEHTPERRFSGRNELPLSLTGRAEAEAAAVRAAGLGVEVVVASPLRRTRETAEIVAAELGLPVTFDKDLVELDFGDVEGLTFDEAREKHPLAARRFMSDISVAAPGGESIVDVGARVSRARRRILSEHAGRTVLVVSHVTPIKLFLAAGLGRRGTRSCTGCSWTPRRCARSPGRRTGAPRCGAVNDTRPLSRYGRRDGGSDAEEQVDRDGDAERHDEDPQRRDRDPGGDAGAEEAADQAGRGGDGDDEPVDRAEQAEDDQRDRGGDRRERGLQRVGQLEPVQRDAEDADQDHAERAAEVAAVDGGEEQGHVQPGRVASGVVVAVALHAAW